MCYMRLFGLKFNLGCYVWIGFEVYFSVGFSVFFYVGYVEVWSVWIEVFFYFLEI